MKYHLHVFGCQMNEADIQRVGSEMEKIGLRAATHAGEADVIVLNTCVVRQSAEDKAHSYIQTLKPIKQRHPDKIITVMGCMVGVKGNGALKRAYPWVDVFMAPSETRPLIDFLRQREAVQLLEQETHERYAIQDGELLLPEYERGRRVSVHVPIVYGCSHACTFCIIPFRRGVERSRPVGEIAQEVRSLAEQGVKEVTLLGQIVDRYGKDVPDGPDLADLLRVVHTIDGIERIRFLTSHPNWMNDKLLDAVAELPKVCEHIEAPVQAGDDDVLKAMRRGYTADDYRRLIDTIRCKLPATSIATDIIVGFPGESEAQFQKTYDLLEELKLDVAHLARYSPRPQTVAQRTLEDDVPEVEKLRRFRELEQLQERVAAEINRTYLGKMVEVLVESQHKGKWRGRTRTNKIVFFEDEADRIGQLANVEITWTGPWSMQGTVTT
ncbi:MAG TPA: tRNA (N6-isopentenyl adenosine(37)-C2)-methylthiotransferase MiaB [Anaerolineae bacterium]|nr:tRNA (N6-isopentenyl adenosine(37)-C2)-methylthiotransferase MiaB [Anaerolineae bacterium]